MVMVMIDMNETFEICGWISGDRMEGGEEGSQQMC